MNRAVTLKPVKVPKLKHWNDEEVASLIRHSFKSAAEGLRNIIRAGVLIECISADLKRGELKPWLNYHVSDIDERTVRRWRFIARGLAKILKLSCKQQFKLEFHKYILPPIEEVPSAIKPLREKLDDIVEGKSQRELLLQFSQTEIHYSHDNPEGEPKKKRGRVKGDGGASAEQRRDANYLRIKSRIHEISQLTDEFSDLLFETCKERTPQGKYPKEENIRLHDLEPELIEKLCQGIESAWPWLRLSRKNRPKSKHTHGYELAES